MTKSKNTKRALLMSILSMMLCIAMLAGSTFAWFTDTVTSGKNRIVAGNLDVELEYKTGNMTGYKNVNAADVPESPFFRSKDGKPINWEPGVMAYTYFKVANVGTLALKYQLSTILDKTEGAEGVLGNGYNTVKDKDGKDIMAENSAEPASLLNALYVKVIDGDADLTGRPPYTAADGVLLKDYLNGKSTTASALEPGASTTSTVVIYWPESEKDNTWNLQNGKHASDASYATDGDVGQLKVLLDVKLIATQYPSEADSFGDDYDANATYNGVEITPNKATALVNQKGDTKLNVNYGSVSVPKDAVAGDTLTLTIEPTDTPEDFSVNVGENEATQSFEISVEGLNAENNVPIPVSLFVEKDLSNVKLYHNNEELTKEKNKVVYDSTTGIITFETTSFSPFTVVFKPPRMVSTADELESAIKGGENIMLAADVELTKTLFLKNASFILDGNGHTITQAENCTTNNVALFDIDGGSATIKNVTFDGIQHVAVIRTVYADIDMDKVTVENCQHTQIQGLLRLLGKSTITNSTFKNNECTMAVTLNYDGTFNAPQVVKNCVFENNTCNGTAVLYYVKGAGATIDGNKFMNNTLTSTGNAATVYMGFTEDNIITNNVFSGNHVTTTHATTNRATGGLMIGYEATITGNAFIDNTITAGDRQLGNDVCASVYYTDIDLSGNYWGGEAPKENDDYFVEYPDNHKVIINDYLTTYGN